ncbi:MAG TPA: c-type cytochrome [Nitrospiria bacterium]|nr:c-type cytochrome [Nitrospiria bacterium]
MKRLIVLIAACIFLDVACFGRTPDIVAGEAKSSACASCHGAAGVSENPKIPNLAGQRPAYTVSALKAYRKGSRKNPEMNRIAAGLSDADIDNLAAYYAGLLPMASKGNPTLSVKGKVSYVFCQECHGPTGAGSGENPRLAGQHADYQVAQMKAYKNGSRKNPIMSGIAAALREEDMRALAEYLAGLK